MHELWNNMKRPKLLIIGMEDQSSQASDIEQILNRFKEENVSKQKKETAIQMDTRDIEHQERTRKKLPVLYYSE